MVKKEYAVVLYVIIAFLVTGYGVYILWNLLMPSIFSLKEISFYEALGLNFLAKMFFQSFEFTFEKEEEEP
jgi:hypothetical protein